MTKHTISFLPHNRAISVEPGTNLLRAALEAGVHINASCGGEGVCGKCRVLVEEGGLEGGGKEKLRADDWDKGYRLACKSKVVEDVTVRVPVESVVDASVLNLAAMPRKTASATQIHLDELKEAGLFIPPVEERYLTLSPPTHEDNVCDMTRLINCLRKDFGERRLVVDLAVLRKLPDVLRQSDFAVTVALSRPVREDGRTRIINVQPGDTSNENYAIAIDIGTTTVYGQLVDLLTGEVLAEHGEFNAQISYGEDVITRIMYAEKPGGMDRLSEVVVGTINKILGKIFAKAKVNPDEVTAVALAGNTTMTQLFVKINPSYIRRAPYVPAASIYPVLKARELGLELPDHVTALIYPCISSYVGGDIVSGVMGSGMYLSDELTLFIDIGTNAEIVVGNKDWMMCAAASAGPAFEGGGVEHGMRATKGAIEDFSLDPVTFEPMNLTIGNQRPKGICGSGLIIMLAKMFLLGVINNQGKFNRDLSTERIRERDGAWEFVVAWAADTQIDRDLTLSEIDIENLIRAKGAMYAAYMTLLSQVGLTIDQLDRIILAGGFGSYVDLESAMTIGLLPETDPDKVTYLGNGSIMGARMSILTNKVRADVVEVTRKMTNVELSEAPGYMDNYVASLFLPHTDINQFPRLKERLEQRNRVMQSK
ncbi:MAG: ASKHA domain-containing protein [Desulfatibacillaceae bacterium]|nr:ASKHA domain-containing protein [Desulfatibacillaceae bacterium]